MVKWHEQKQHRQERCRGSPPPDASRDGCGWVPFPSYSKSSRRQQSSSSTVPPGRVSTRVHSPFLPSSAFVSCFLKSFRQALALVWLGVTMLVIPQELADINKALSTPHFDPDWEEDESPAFVTPMVGSSMGAGCLLNRLAGVGRGSDALPVLRSVCCCGLSE